MRCREDDGGGLTQPSLLLKWPIIYRPQNTSSPTHLHPRHIYTYEALESSRDYASQYTLSLDVHEDASN